MTEYIDLTPTWTQILPTWLRLYRKAILTGNTVIRENAEAEFARMAEAADRWNEEHAK